MAWIFGLPEAVVAAANGYINGTVTVNPTFPELAPNGTVGAPPYSFTNSTNTGMYLPAAGQLAFTVGGVLKADFGLTNAGNWTFQNTAFFPGGNVVIGQGAQILTLGNGRTTLGSALDGQMLVSNNAGTQSVNFTVGASNLLTLNGGLAIGAAPLSWNADTGLSRTSAGNLALGNGTQGNATGNLALNATLLSAVVDPANTTKLLFNATSVTGGFFQFLQSGTLPAGGFVLVEAGATGASWNNTSGLGVGIKIDPTITQTGTAGYSALYINTTETTTGSGAKLLVDANVGGVSKFKVDNTGLATSASPTLYATSVALTNGAAAATATLTNGPTAGNPTKWIPINDNGVTRYIPAW